MKFKMLKDCRGSENGYIVLTFKKDKVYDLSDELANDFINMGVVEIIEDEIKLNEKKIDAAPKNKSLDSAPHNKSKKGK